jgi:hypothetical protein
MRATGLLLCVLMLAACGGDADDDDVAADSTAMSGTPSMGPAPGDSSMAGMNHDSMAAAAGGAGALTFTAVPGSSATGLSGEAMVTPKGDQSEVMVMVRGAPASAVLQAHVHKGRCGTDEGVAAPLDPVTAGEDGAGSSNTTVALPSATVMNGQHYVQVHDPNGSPGAPALCVDVPAGA